MSNKDISYIAEEEKVDPTKPTQVPRKNLGKPPIDLNFLGKEAQVGLARVWEHGLEKYGRGNWTKGYSYTSLLGCASRHLIDFVNGIDLDLEPDPLGRPASGLPTIDLLLANVYMLSQMYHTRKDLDDRGILKPE